MEYLLCASPLLIPRYYSPAHLCETEQVFSTSFQPILGAALTDYTKQVAIELTNYPLVDTFQFCGSPNDVLKLLDDTINQFGDFRNGNRKLLNWLSPVVHVVRTLSAALGASITLVSQDILVLFVSFFFHQFCLSGSVRTSKGNFCRSGRSNLSTYPIIFCNCIAS